MVFLVALAVSILFTVVILTTDKFHKNFTHDRDLSGRQKFHYVPVPRVGGVAFILGFFGGAVYYGFENDNELYLLYWAGVAAVPVFIGGFLEDLSKNIKVINRLLLAFFSAAIAHYELGLSLDRIGWVWFDENILVIPGVSLALMVFMVGGVAHATNIIDGFNGLLLGFVVLVLGVFGWVAYQVGDVLALNMILIMGGATVGLFIFNFPRGKIFLGDGGAYFIGFLLALISLLILRNRQISPWFPLLVLSYPVFETIFSIYRKKVLRGTPITQPDRFHLHMLVHRRIVGKYGKWFGGNRNAATAPVMWGVSSLGMLPALFWWDRDWVMQLSIFAFCFGYIMFYFSIVRFKFRRIFTS